MNNDVRTNDEAIEVNHSELEFLINNAYRTKKPLFILGTIGIGKSETVKKVAMRKANEVKRKYVEWVNLDKKEKLDIIDNPKKYFVLIDKRLSEFDPTDVKGLPFPDGDVVDWKGDLWLKFITLKDAMGCVFFDELNLGSPATQKSFYKVINDHQVAEKKISDDIIIIGAGNRDSDRSNVHQMPKALDNRFKHCSLAIPDIDTWIDWAFENNVDSRIIAYLKQRPSNLFTFDPNRKDKAFGTPRSWGNFCSDDIKPIKDDEKRKLELLIAESVGIGIANEFVGWLESRKKIDLNEVLEKPELAKDITEQDMKYALVSLITEWYRNGKQDINALNKLNEIINYLDDEFKMLTINFIKKADKGNELEFVKKYSKCKGYKELIDSVGELIDEAN